MRFFQLSRWHIITGIFISLITYNEYVCFLIKRLSWPVIKHVNGIDILLVADPQILSTLSEPLYPLSIPAVWDANRFVSKAYHHVVSFSKPHIIVFLGDLLNDGSISDSVQFSQMATEFRRIFYIPKEVKHAFFIPGDNDIGGEGFDFVNSEKIRRFNKAFDVADHLSYEYLNLFHINAIPRADSFLQDSDVPPKLAPSSFNVVFSHFSILPSAKKSINEKIGHLNTSIIFSGHNHNSYKFIGSRSGSNKESIKSDKFFVLDKDEIVEINLRKDELHEITVPTCSYRMGKRDYGFGLARISESGQLVYTVLWLPCRFTMLIMYLVGVTVCLSLCLKPVALSFIHKFGNLASIKHHVI